MAGRAIIEVHAEVKTAQRRLWALGGEIGLDLDLDLSPSVELEAFARPDVQKVEAEMVMQVKLLTFHFPESFLDNFLETSQLAWGHSIQPEMQTQAFL